jgi:hypothetical protein
MMSKRDRGRYCSPSGLLTCKALHDTDKNVMTSQHLVSLVLQSKKALQHSEQLCSRANSLSNESSSCATEVLALDATVKWISDAVVEQLKVGLVHFHHF